MTTSGCVVYGGTFDPVHFGHLRTAVELRESLNVATVRLIPSAAPPHRRVPGATAEQRSRMLRLAVADVPGLAVDDRELQRAGHSYTIDTLTSLRDELGPAVPLYLALGIDAFALLDSWKRWRELSDFCHIVVLDRPGFDFHQIRPEVLNFLKANEVADSGCLQDQTHGRVVRLRLTQFDVSASMIRQLIGNHQSIDYLTPVRVIEYIRQQELYVSAH